MEHLTEYVRAQADWRRKKADEFPDDERNLRSAEALESLADFIEHGSEEDFHESELKHPTLPIMDEYLRYCHGEPDEFVKHLLSRHGYERPLPSDWRQAYQHSGVLNDCVVHALVDAHNAMRESGDEDTDLFTSEEVAAAREDVELDRDYWDRRGFMTEQEQESWIDACRQEQRAIR